MTAPLRPTDPIMGPARGERASATNAALNAKGVIRSASVGDYITEVYRLAPLCGIDPAVVVAQSALETDNWRSEAWKKRLNPAGIGIVGQPGEPGYDLGYQWASGTDAARGQIVHLYAYLTGPNDGREEWRTYLSPYSGLDPRYWDVIEAGYEGTVRTINDLTGKWATDPDYAAKICRRGNELFGWTEENTVAIKMKSITLVGLGDVRIPADIEFESRIISPSQKNQRPGVPFTGGSADWYTQHDTGNTRAGTGADMHANWLHQGAPDASGRSQVLSFHLVADDTKIIQLLPLNEIAWHAGDGYGPGNYDSYACELCVNRDGNFTKAQSIAESLAAAVLYKRNWDSSKVVQHNKWSGKDCPHSLRSRTGDWSGFIAGVNNARVYEQMQKPAPSLVYPEGMDEELAKVWFGYVEDGLGTHRFDPNGPVSQLWLQLGAENGRWPSLSEVTRYDTRRYWLFDDGLVLWRPNDSAPVRVLKAA